MPTVSIAISSLNRKDELRQTLTEIRKLDPQPLEILICLDGCTDGSKEMMEEFPEVTAIKHELPKGSVVSRDELFRQSKADIIVSLDDDSAPLQTDFVGRVAKAAIEHPEAGVFTFDEVRPPGRDDRPFPMPERQCYVASYPNCAGAIRSSLYGEKASYPHIFFHMYEEPDFCLQAYANNQAVLFIPDIKVLHRYSDVGRNLIRRHHQHSRNELLSVFMRCPVPHVFWLAFFRVVRQFAYASQQGLDWVVREPLWWWQSIKSIPSALRVRNSVSWRIYWQWIRLARNPIYSKGELIERFPNVHVKTEDS